MIVDEQTARAFVAERCDNEAMERLERLEGALRAENERQNLVSRGTLGAMWLRHIADSAQLLDRVPRETPGPWLDLGSGAGFPGLVVAAMRPDWTVVLVESRRKRVDWLEATRLDLGLSNCQVEGSRLELLDTLSAGVISARAFAPLAKLLGLAQRFSTNDTIWLLPKGRSAEQELSELPARWREVFHVEQSQTDETAKILVGRGMIGA